MRKKLFSTSGYLSFPFIYLAEDPNYYYTDGYGEEYDYDGDYYYEEENIDDGKRSFFQFRINLTKWIFRS